MTGPAKIGQICTQNLQIFELKFTAFAIWKLLIIRKHIKLTELVYHTQGPRKVPFCEYV